MRVVRRVTERRTRELGLIAVAGLAAALAFLLVKDSLTDDAYITLAYAKNLALDLHWGLIPQETSNSATSPLNVLLLGAATGVTRLGGGVHPVLALGAVSVALAMTMAYAWVRVARALELPLAAAALGVALVLSQPFLLSAIGLEVLLVAALIAVLLATAVEGRPAWFGVVAGLVLLARLDLVVVIVVMFAATPAVRRTWRPAVAACVAVAAPWFLFSWIHFGSAVPDTVVLKTSLGQLFGPWNFAAGPVAYYLDQPNTALAAFLPAVIGVLLLSAWVVARTAVRWPAGDALPAFGPVAGLGLGGVAHYGVFALLDAGPFHWYYVAPATTLSSFAVLAAGRWLVVARTRPALRPTAPALVLGALGLLAAANAVVDLRREVPWESPVIFGNWANARDYARVGRELRSRVGDRTVAGPGEIGTLAFFCECAVVDSFSDRGRAIDRIEDYTEDAAAPKRLALELNYIWLDRDREPRPAQFRLLFQRPPRAGPNSFRVDSGARGPGSFTLVENPGR